MKNGLPDETFVCVSFQNVCEKNRTEKTRERENVPRSPPCASDMCDMTHGSSHAPQGKGMRAFESHCFREIARPFGLPELPLVYRNVYLNDCVVCFLFSSRDAERESSSFIDMTPEGNTSIEDTLQGVEKLFVTTTRVN